MLISNDLQWAVARELADTHGAGAVESAWRRAGVMLEAGNQPGFEMWANVAKKVGAIHRARR